MQLIKFHPEVCNVKTSFARNGLNIMEYGARCRFLWVPLFIATAGSCLAQPDRITGRAFATRSEIIAQNGMVATSHPLATQIGLDILKAGGSAVDAAIAANAALGLMEPPGCGIGGDLFAIVWSAGERRLYGLNASGRTPLDLSREQLRAELSKLGRTSFPKRGVLPITVPGTVDGWSELHKKFGRLPVAELLAPTIRYAEGGFPLTQYIARSWNIEVMREHAAPNPGGFLDVYALSGRAPREGEIFKNPSLAGTYRRLATNGLDDFYRGEIANQVDAFMRAHGGYLRKTDLEKHMSNWIDPVSINYRGCEIFELPPNGQGIAALQMLNILEGYDLRAMGRGSPDALHVMIEAKKLAFEDRARFYGDPEFSEIPLAGLLSKEYAVRRRQLIDMDQAALAYDVGNPSLNDGDTICLATADSQGNMVSLIQSNYAGMGSHVVVPDLGFAFQNRGEAFVFQEGHANDYAPGKRPFHTIIPAFIARDGKPRVCFALMGGPMQPQGHVQIVTNLIDFDLSLQEAGDAARWQHVGSTDYNNPPMRDGGHVELESGFPYETARALQQRGHDIRSGHGRFGGFQGIMWDDVNQTYRGATESRRDGRAAGW